MEQEKMIARELQALKANPLIIKTAAQRTALDPKPDRFGVTSGVSFDGVHSFRDWGLYLKERPNIAPPEPKTTLVSVPCRDGDIDISTALTDGEIRFANRQIECKFSTFDNVKDWASLFSRIENFLHGRQIRVIMDNDPEFYYIGRCTVEPMETNDYRGYINIKIDAQPYKKDIVGSMDQWIWDIFNFETGVIMSWGNMQISGTRAIEIEGDRQTIIPKFNVLNGSLEVAVKYKDETNTETLTAGIHEPYSLRIREGANTMILKGAATVLIDYRAGSL